MIHPHTELRPAGVLGHGVFATRSIPKGTIVWALDPLDQCVDAARRAGLAAVLLPGFDRYAYTNARGDSVLCWDLGRFVNHSCAANVLSTGWEFDLAVDDIAAGTQLTTDYASLNLDQPFECQCAAPACRGVVCDEDFEALADGWDERVAAAFARSLAVEQPLWPLVSDLRAVLRRARRGLRPPSIRCHRRTAAPPSQVAERP